MALLDTEKLTEAQLQELSIDVLLECRSMLTILLARQAGRDAAASGLSPEQELKNMSQEILNTQRAYLQKCELPMVEPNPSPEDSSEMPTLGN